jgi:hypothetical protein
MSQPLPDNIAGLMKEFARKSDLPPADPSSGQTATHLDPAARPPATP